MSQLPLYIYLSFGAITLLTIGIFYLAARQSNIVLTVLGSWLAVQSALALSGFYTITDTFPPRLVMLVFPPLLAIGTLFLTKKGRSFIDALDLKWLTLIHLVRLPIEIILYWLFVQKGYQN